MLTNRSGTVLHTLAPEGLSSCPDPNCTRNQQTHTSNVTELAPVTSRLLHVPPHDHGRTQKLQGVGADHIPHAANNVNNAQPGARSDSSREQGCLTATAHKGDSLPQQN